MSRMSLVMVVVVGIGSWSAWASAQPGTSRSAATSSQTSSPAPRKPVPPPVKARPRVRPPAAPATTDVLVQYQRVGRELFKLEELRGHRSCAELWPVFRTIKLDAALATPEARTSTAAMLSELQLQIERMRGVVLTRACLDNPLAKECS
jgi:hypothetical protein